MIIIIITTTITTIYIIGTIITVAVPTKRIGGFSSRF